MEEQTLAGMPVKRITNDRYTDAEWMRSMHP